MIALQAYSSARLAGALGGLTLPEARKLVSAVNRGFTLSAPAPPVPGVRRPSMDLVRREGYVPELRVKRERASALDPFLKLALETRDGHVIETVRIPLEREGRFSVCVSSQVGCALACAFCATGRLGLERNLETWEIVEQVRLVRQTLRGPSVPPSARVHGVVFQGMGEPLANLDRVLEAIDAFCDPSGLAIDARNMTVCTAGIPGGIRRLAREAPRVRLGLSIASARRDVRRRLMPITAAHPLEDVIDAAVEHAKLTGLAPLWALTPLAGVNDTEEDAIALGALAREFTLRAGVRPRVSIIPYNAIALHADPFSRTDDVRERAFRDVLAAHGHPTHKRYSGGGDVGAACGQLAGKA